MKKYWIGNVYIDSNGHEIVNYEKNTENGAEYQLEIDKTNLDGENLTLEERITEDEAESIVDVVISDIK